MKFIFLFFLTTLFGSPSTQNELPPIKKENLTSPSENLIAYFQPPSGWQMADPTTLSPHVQALFMGKPENNFCPTINLALEKIDTNLKEYFKSVKEFHRSNPEETWRDLGKFSFQCGEGRLTEITSPSPVGEIKMLQALFVKNKTAYVITAAALKSDFSKHQNQMIQAIRSLKIIPDLFSVVPQPEKRVEIESLFATLGGSEESDQTKQWEDWQKLLETSNNQMGEYWHYLALRQGWAKIHGHQSAAE